MTQPDPRPEPKPRWPRTRGGGPLPTVIVVLAVLLALALLTTGPTDRRPPPTRDSPIERCVNVLLARQTNHC